jgi:hypothetical protein
LRWLSASTAHRHREVGLAGAGRADAEIDVVIPSKAVVSIPAGRRVGLKPDLRWLTSSPWVGIHADGCSWVGIHIDWRSQVGIHADGIAAAPCRVETRPT